MISGIEKYKLEQYEDLIETIMCECTNIEEVAKAITDTQYRIRIYTEGFNDATPKYDYYGDK